MEKQGIPQWFLLGTRILSALIVWQQLKSPLLVGTDHSNQYCNLSSGYWFSGMRTPKQSGISFNFSLNWTIIVSPHESTPPLGL